MPQTADFDHTLFEQGNNDGDKNLLVKFFNKPKKNDAKSLEAQRPIFDEVCYVDIRVAGKRDPLAVRPATMRDKQRFPRHYAAFEQRTEMPVDGTPLLEWGCMTRSQAEELAFANIKTVEQLATMPDGNAQKFMGGFAMKQKAKDWLESTADNAGDLKYKELADTTAKENAELKGKLEEQSNLIAQMSERLNALEQPEPDAKPSRRRRASNNED